MAAVLPRMFEFYCTEGASGVMPLFFRSERTENGRRIPQVVPAGSAVGGSNFPVPLATARGWPGLLAFGGAGSQFGWGSDKCGSGFGPETFAGGVKALVGPRL